MKIISIQSRDSIWESEEIFQCSCGRHGSWALSTNRGSQSWLNCRFLTVLWDALHPTLLRDATMGDGMDSGLSNLLQLSIQELIGGNYVRVL